MTRKHISKWMQEKPNDFEQKYGNRENNEIAEWINNMTKELKGLEEGLKVEIDIDLLKKKQKNIQLENARPC